MQLDQYVLGKVAEEATEVAQRALKAQQFGADQAQPGNPPNWFRLHEEVLDLLGWYSEAAHRGLVPEITAADIAEHMNEKRNTVVQMARLSHSLGMLESD